MAGYFETIKKSFSNVFGIQEKEQKTLQAIGMRPAQQSTYSTRRGILYPLIARISVDVANIVFHHVLLDADGRYIKNQDSELEKRLTLKANIDQTGFSFIKDAVEIMLDHGAVALVPCDVSNDPRFTTGYEIYSIRSARILENFTTSVAVNLYNEATGNHERIIVPKTYVAVCYNPMHKVMNDSNSTLSRLVNKLNLLDKSDNRIHSSNLDLILQLPFAIRNEKRQEEANKRVSMIENQLSNSQYGVAYIDATERITQLNRSVESSLPEQVLNLEQRLYNQLGLTQSVLDGTASAEQMGLYYSRTIDPIVKELTVSMTAAFLSTTAIKQGHAIRAYMPLFSMAPVGTIAEAADKFTRNEILSPGEVRAEIGIKKSDDPESEKLRNRNIAHPIQGAVADPTFSGIENPTQDGLSEEKNDQNSEPPIFA